MPVIDGESLLKRIKSSPKLTEDMFRNSLSEAVNTLAGCFLRELFTDEVDYIIGPPESGRGDLPKPNPKS